MEINWKKQTRFCVQMSGTPRIDSGLSKWCNRNSLSELRTRCLAADRSRVQRSPGGRMVWEIVTFSLGKVWLWRTTFCDVAARMLEQNSTGVRESRLPTDHKYFRLERRIERRAQMPRREC